VIFGACAWGVVHDAPLQFWYENSWFFSSTMQSDTTIGGILPDGTSSVPKTDNVSKDPDFLGIIWGYHPKMRSEHSAHFTTLITY
jgi:hypothetical protein